MAQEQQLAVQAAQSGSTLALNQYKAGTVSYLNVVIAQTTGRAISGSTSPLYSS